MNFVTKIIKATFKSNSGIAALPPNYDTDCAYRHVCFGSLADICNAISHVRLPIADIGVVYSITSSAVESEASPFTAPNS
jgi:hypothetical protein